MPSSSDVPRLLRLPSLVGERGRLVPADAGVGLPFPVARYFVLADVPPGATRGGHAQRRARQLLSCVAGNCTVDLRHRGRQETHRLQDPTEALYLPPWTWVECRDFSHGAVVVVMCSEAHDPDGVVTDPEEFAARAGSDPA